MTMTSPATQKVPSRDIETAVAALASRQSQARPGRARPPSGPERAAVLMLALGEEYGGKVWSLLDDDELRKITIVMSTIGTVDSSAVEDLLLEFVSRLSASGAVMGNYDATERLLPKDLPRGRG